MTDQKDKRMSLEELVGLSDDELRKHCLEEYPEDYKPLAEKVEAVCLKNKVTAEQFVADYFIDTLIKTKGDVYKATVQTEAVNRLFEAGIFKAFNPNAG